MRKQSLIPLTLKQEASLDGVFPKNYTKQWGQKTPDLEEQPFPTTLTCDIRSSKMVSFVHVSDYTSLDSDGKFVAAQKLFCQQLVAQADECLLPALQSAMECIIHGERNINDIDVVTTSVTTSGRGQIVKSEELTLYPLVEDED